MRKWLLVVGCIAIAMAASTVASAATASEAPESVTLDGCMAKRSAVEYPHKLHADTIECVTCHHTQEGLAAESDMTVETCDSCHLSPADEATPDCTQMSLSKNPYHINCVGCHKEDGAETAPTKCDDCHPKAG
jgi:hypothetical protein